MVPVAESLWHTSRDAREKILGNALKQVGGSTPGLEGIGRGGAKDKKDIEAIWHHTMHPKFNKERAWSYCLKRAVNLSGSDGAFLSWPCVRPRCRRWRSA